MTLGWKTVSGSVRHLLSFQMINETRHAPGAEPIVDIHDGDAVRTTVEHAQQRGDAAEARAVTDARRDGNHRHLDESRDHAWQRAFHARDDDNHARVLQTRLLRQQAMETGHAD